MTIGRYTTRSFDKIVIFVFAFMKPVKKTKTILGAIDVFCFARIALASVLGLVILFSQFNSAFILINYQLNKEVIAQKYCVNKDKPQMKCNGKCHMKKELAKNENRNNKTNFSKEKEMAKLSVERLHLVNLVFSAKQNHFPPYFMNFPSDRSDIASPPPKLSC